ncbi:MAG: metallophosphoesterase family protein [Candidatus Babeliales bacterium]
MFFKNFITKSLFLFILGSFIGLSAMEQETLLQLAETNPSVQSVFGHRLRLKNCTDRQIGVDVKKLDESCWGGIVEDDNSMDLGSIHDNFFRITITIYQTPELKFELPIDQIKQFLCIPVTQMLFCIVDEKSGEYKIHFEPADCKKNVLSSFINLSAEGIGDHPAYQAFPAFKNEFIRMCIREMNMDAFQKFDPVKFHQYVLGIDSVFTYEDIQNKADRLMQEWNPIFYSQDENYAIIERVQEYIKSARRFLLRALQDPSLDEGCLEEAAAASTHPEFQRTDVQQEEASTSQSAYSRFPGIQDSAQQKYVTTDYFYFLLNKVKETTSSYEEQKKCNPAYNTRLLEVFEMDEPIISAEELYELINKCIRNYDEQTKIRVDDHNTYIQKQFITPGSEFKIVGDIHGSIHSLVKILENTLTKVKNDTNFVFLGDYTDRGLFGTEVLALLMCLKLAAWDKVFLLRGNHESYGMNLHGGWGQDESGIFIGSFNAELEAKYGIENGTRLLLQFKELYNRLPLAVYLGTNPDTWVQFCHGGFQPDFNPNEFLSNSENIQKIEFGESNLTSESNGFVWGDFYLRNNQIVQDVSGRGTGLNFIRNIPNVISSDSGQKSPEFTGVKAIFRGHQHSGCGLKMFPRITDESMNKYENKSGLGLEPMPWNEVTKNNRDGLVYETVKNEYGDETTTCKLRIDHYIPIFTFSTATEHGLTNKTFYGILQTTDNFSNWLLQPISIE